MAKGVDIELAPLGEDHVRAKITWSEQDVGGGTSPFEVSTSTMSFDMKTPQAEDRRDSLKDQIAKFGSRRAFRASTSPTRSARSALAPSTMVGGVKSTVGSRPIRWSA